MVSLIRRLLVSYPVSFWHLPVLGMPPIERDNVVYWKTKGKINNDLQSKHAAHNSALLEELPSSSLPSWQHPPLFSSSL